MQHVPPHNIQALLFDLGGVLLDIDFMRAFSAWSRFSTLTAEEMHSAFQFDEYYQRHERGEISAKEYFAHLQNTLKISGSTSDMCDGWNAIFVEEITETRRMVNAARSRLPCYMFTNTNATHLAAWTTSFPQLVEPFKVVFASSEMGLRKPESKAFEHIASNIGVPPASIMFFDDLLENVQGAQDAGFCAVHVRSSEDVANALHGLGIAL